MHNHKNFLLILTLFIIFQSITFVSVFNIQKVYATPVAGYVVNESKKLCKYSRIGDERGDINFGNCKIKYFPEDPNVFNPRKICELNGYTYVEEDVDSFCHGLFFGRLETGVIGVIIKLLRLSNILIVIITLIIAFYLYKKRIKNNTNPKT